MAKSKIKFYLFSLLVIFFSDQFSFAQISFSQNHPELKWKQINSRHFTIIYHNGVEETAVKIGQIAEEIYPRITADIGAEPPQRTPIIVTDYMDISNGLSNPLGHTIFLWTRAMEKYTTGDENWLKSLIAHEFTHIVSFYAARGSGGYWHELISLGFIPTWFLEGVAQLEAERWCAHRDMLLRVTAYHRELLPYKRLTGFIAADQIDARLVYEQGHSLARYIYNKFGHDKIKLIFQRLRSFPFSFNFALKKAIGLSEKQLFRDWESEIKRHYDKQFSMQTPVMQFANEIKLPFQGIFSAKFSPNGKYLAFVAVKDFDSHVRELYVKDLFSGKIKKLASPFVSSIFDWSPDSKKIVFAKLHIIPNGSEVFDLFLLNIFSRKTEQLTIGERANDPAFSPRGDKIVYSKHEKAGSNLWFLDLVNKKRLKITHFGLGTEVFTPRWSPNGQQIAFSLFDEKSNRDILVLDLKNNKTFPIISTPADERYPAWSPDGKKLAFISYRNGTPNLFIKDLQSKETLQITASPGGVFLPEWIPDRNQIAVISFETRRKISAVLIDLDDIIPIETKQVSTLPFHESPSPVYMQQRGRQTDKPIVLTHSLYNSYKNIRPQILLPFADQNENGWQPGAIMRLADPVEKNVLLIAATYQKRPHLYFDYVNRMHSPTIEFYFEKSTINHGDFLFFSDGSAIPLYENYQLASFGLSWQMNTGKSILSWHRFSTLMSFSQRTIINRTDYADPDIPEKFLPFQGWINSLGFAYSFIRYRPDVFYAVHPRSGFSFSAALRIAPEFLNNELTFTRLSLLNVMRKELPYLKHVIALRSGLFLREGDSPVQSRPALSSAYLRGTDYSRSGNRQLFANVEYRFPIFRDIGLKIWVLYFEHLAGAVFTDIGKAWYAGKTNYYGKKYHFNEMPWTQTAGLALRHRLYLLGKIPLVLQLSYGINIKNQKEKGFAFLIANTF